jgi:hypothetical protein
MLRDGATLSARWFQPAEEKGDTSYGELWRIDPTTKGRTYCINNGEFYMYGKDTRNFELTGSAALKFAAASLFSVSMLLI